jgi:hypothetical protein
MKRILTITIRVISIVLLVPPLLLALPGVILNILSEEMDNKTIEDNMKEYDNDY